jgi:hypothetical protein
MKLREDREQHTCNPNENQRATQLLITTQARGPRRRGTTRDRLPIPHHQETMSQEVWRPWAMRSSGARCAREVLHDESRQTPWHSRGTRWFGHGQITHVGVGHTAVRPRCSTTAPNTTQKRARGRAGGMDPDPRDMDTQITPREQPPRPNTQWVSCSEHERGSLPLTSKCL